MLHRPVDAGDVYIGPGDLYRFLVTGAARQRVLRDGGLRPARRRPAASHPILTFTPAGIEHFFAEPLEHAASLDAPVPDNLAEVAARYAEAAPRYGMTFV